MNTSMADTSEWLEEIKWDSAGLVPVIAQDATSKRVLMFAWMNREALSQTVQTGEAVYWSRSRRRLWHKGESSGHVQRVQEMRIDCDSDVLLLLVAQTDGIACHTGRESCFYRVLNEGNWTPVDPIIKDPEDIYG